MRPIAPTAVAAAGVDSVAAAVAGGPAGSTTGSSGAAGTAQDDPGSTGAAGTAGDDASTAGEDGGTSAVSRGRSASEPPESDADMITAAGAESVCDCAVECRIYDPSTCRPVMSSIPRRTIG